MRACGIMHAVAQPPQWPTSVVTSTQPDPHCVRPGPQVVEHAPIEHTCPAGHA
jgi:hypothetical protein